jgi:hypothetical protein
MAKSMMRLNCNLCSYNLLVSEALEQWAISVMQAHGERAHPQALEPNSSPTELPNKETPNE